MKVRYKSRDGYYNEFYADFIGVLNHENGEVSVGGAYSKQDAENRRFHDYATEVVEYRIRESENSS